MASPFSFVEERPVGGVPIFLWLTRKLLPKNKMKRELLYKVQMVIFTYSIYAIFNLSRRPMSVVQSRLIRECTETIQSKVMNETCSDIIHNYKTPEAIWGLLDLFFCVSYGVCLYVSGIVADSYNPRYYLTAGCFLSGFICVLMGLIDYWEIQDFKFKATLMILFGAALSTAWPVVLSSVTHWYGVVGKRRGMFFGFWNTHNYVGSIIGILLAGIWVDKDFMWSFFVPAFILAVVGVMVFMAMVVDAKDLKQLDIIESSALSRSSKSKERVLGKEVPAWLSSDTSITMYEVWTLPGVLEFSTCMFFSRMVGYIFLFWLPVFMQQTNEYTASDLAYYSISYAVGGSIGGILAGIFVDLSKRSAVVCASFLLLSIPILLATFWIKLGNNLIADFPLIIVIGLLVEAPYVVISTSVSADLGTHKLIKRNNRALSTVGGIIEGTGAIGASIGTYITGIILVHTTWKYILFMMAGSQFVAILCLSRQIYKECYIDHMEENTLEEISSYLKIPSIM